MNMRELLWKALGLKMAKRAGPKPKYTYEHVGNEPHFHKCVKKGVRQKVKMVPIIRAHLIDYSKSARRARGELPPLTEN